MHYYIFALTLISTFSTILAALQCFCTEEGQCEVFGVCHGAACVVGLLKNDQMVRTCGSEPSGCHQNMGRWKEVCACTEPMCNTFVFYRNNMNRDDEAVVFDRRNTELSSDTKTASEEQSSSQSSLLTILIVAVPLAVGAAMVVVVAFNYYCHLC